MIYTRLSYNTQDWHQPSGPNGKSRNKGVHEYDYKFGFEEWLCSENCFLPDENGERYHYGYLEGIHKNYKQGDENDSLFLFTIQCATKQRFKVAEIKVWKKVDPSESHYIAQQNPMLVKSMKNNISVVTNNFQMAITKFNLHVNNQNGFQLFNIKYKKINFEINANNLPIEKDQICNFNRFWLYRR